MPGGAHEAQRRARFGQRPAAVDDGLQLTCRNARHNVAQHPADPLRIGLLQDIQLQDVVGDVRPGRRHLVLGENVAPGHLHKAAPVPQTGQAGVDEALAGEAVQHDVHPGAAGRLEDLFAERRGAAVEHVLDAERAQVRLLGGACGGEDLRTRSLHPLDGGQTHAARARVNQNPLAGLQSGILEGQGSRDEGAGDGRESGLRDIRRSRSHQFLVGDHHRPERAESHPDDVVAHRDPGHLRPDLDDAATHLPAQQPLLDEPQRTEHVPEVEPGRAHGDADFPGLQGTGRKRLHVRPIEHPARIRSQHPVGFLRQRQPLGFGLRADQARYLPAPEAVDDVILGVGIEEFVHEVGFRRHLSRIQIDHPGLQVRRFPGHALAEAPQGRAGQFPSALTLQHLRSTGHEPDALCRGEAGIGHALRHGQGARAVPFDVVGHVAGRRVLSGTVECHQVRDSAEGHVTRKAVDQRPP